jgi:transmembrane sensor
MNGGPNRPARGERAKEAATWVLRVDRGLTPVEQDAYSEWLAADPRNGQELARQARQWQRLDQLTQWRPEHGAQPNPDLLAPPLRARLRPWMRVPLVLAAAAALLVAFSVWRSRDAAEGATAARVAVAPDPGERVLEDGTHVELNRDAAIEVAFSPAERRVRLLRGEAHFTVTKNPARPFIVNAAGIDVRAVGTAFNVRVDAASVEVLVTEGKVQLDADLETGPAAPTSAPLVPVLAARQRAVVPLGVSLAQVEPPQIATLTRGEIDRVLAWQHRLLDFTNTPLTEIVAEFNRRNQLQLVISDPELARIRVSASLRSDNVDGFVRLLQAGFGVQPERRGDAEILLRTAAKRAATGAP